MIRVMTEYLLIYALIDATIQIVFQLPAVLPGDLDGLRKYGFRKVWKFDAGKQDYTNYGKKPEDLGDLTYSMFIECSMIFKENKETGFLESTGNCPHIILDWRAFYFSLMNCFIIAVIVLQCEIFGSAGYLKYVTQHGGSMDLLM